MYGSYQAGQGNLQPQGTGYFQQVPNQQQQQQQQQQMRQNPGQFGQFAPNTLGYGNLQQGTAGNFANNVGQFQQQNTASSPYAPNNANGMISSNVGAQNTTGMQYGQQGGMSQFGYNDNNQTAKNSLSNVPSNVTGMQSLQGGNNQMLQPQGTGFYSPAAGNNMGQPTSMQPQGTGYYSQMANQQQQMQPQGTGYFPNTLQSTAATGQPHAQQPQPQQPMQPLQPQQTGFYTQQFQQQGPVLEPLKPTATGFVNSFANNGINKDIKIPAIRLSFITAKDQAKFEKLFRSLVANGSNTVSGDKCRNVLMKSGLQPSQLARIWTLCDTDRAGELLFPEFALAMHLVNNVLQGDSIPYELDSKTKNEVSSFIDAINLSIASSSSTNLAAQTPFDNIIHAGLPNLQPQPTGMIPQTSFGMPLQNQMTGGPVSNTMGMLNPQATGLIPQTSFGLGVQTTGGPTPIMAQNIGGRLQPQGTGFVPQTSFGNNLQTQLTGGTMAPPTSFGNAMVPGATGLQPQGTGNIMGGGIQPQMTGGMPGQMTSQLTGGLHSVLNNNQMTGTGAMPLQAAPTGYLPPSNFNPTAPLTAQKTGFGNNEIYSQLNFGSNLPTANEDAITPEEKSLFYKIFETYDSSKRGLLDSPTAVEIFRKSGLNRSDLEHIWNLCDTNNSGQLNKQEFALGMHLVYGRLNGKPLPPRLPPSLIPSSTKILDNVKNQLKTHSGDDNKRVPLRTDALSYKNNDEEEALPNFRNRRKIFPSATSSSNNDSTTVAATPTTTTSKNTDTLSKPADSNSKQSIPSSSADNDRNKIDSLRNAIKSKRHKLDELRAKVQQKNKGSTNVDALKVRSLQEQIRSLPVSVIPKNNTSVPEDIKNRMETMLSRIPQLFAEMSQIETMIATTKIELYKVQNPSSIVGSGPNGEITEEDRKKAKSKALLKSRMAALTGKPSDETASFEEDERKYIDAVRGIQKDSEKNDRIISDIRDSICEIFATTMSSLTNGSIGKEVKEFSKWEFGVGLNPEIREFIMGLHSSAHSTNEDRSAMLREQAQRKMEQKLAEIGISNGSGTPSESLSPDHSNTNQNKTSPFEESVRARQFSDHKEEEEEDDDDDDEEEKRLQEELQQLKLKKKADKEKRLAMLRQQVEAAKAESEEEEGEEDKEKKVTQQSQYTRPPTTVPIAAPVANVNVPRGNPFSYQQGQNATISSSTTSSFDAKAAEAQRRKQRGEDSDEDDGWSDDDDKLEDARETQVEETTSAPAAATPIAPPPPPAAAPTNHLAPVPIAPPLPQINIEKKEPNAAPVPIAPPPIPQMNNSNNNGSVGMTLPPPPPLPSQDNNVQTSTANDDDDNDDVLSIPESVESNEEQQPQQEMTAPAGIPPPPPLPQL